MDSAYGKSASEANNDKLVQADQKLADAKAQVAKAQAINEAVQKAIASVSPAVPSESSNAAQVQPVAKDTNTTPSN